MTDESAVVTDNCDLVEGEGGLVTDEGSRRTHKHLLSAHLPTLLVWPSSASPFCPTPSLNLSLRALWIQSGCALMEAVPAATPPWRVLPSGEAYASAGALIGLFGALSLIKLIFGVPAQDTEHGITALVCTFFT